MSPEHRSDSGAKPSPSHGRQYKNDIFSDLVVDSESWAGLYTDHTRAAHRWRQYCALLCFSMRCVPQGDLAGCRSRCPHGRRWGSRQRHCGVGSLTSEYEERETWVAEFLRNARSLFLRSRRSNRDFGEHVFRECYKQTHWRTVSAGSWWGVRNVLVNSLL